MTGRDGAGNVLHVDLEGKVAVVSGASKGIGRGVCQALADAGATVFGSARSEVEVDGVTSVPVDLATPAGPARLAQAALDAAGRIDIVVNNVGGIAAPRTGGFLALSDEEWHENFDLNFFSAVRLSRATLPHLVEQRGSMVNISSVGALTPGPFHIDYAASKSALNALTKALSVEFGPRGVRVNLVSVGTIFTEGWMDPGRFGDQLAAQMGITKEEAMELMITQLGELSLPRWGQVDEVVRAVMFFVSDAASYCSGADLRVDGGLYKGL